MRQQMLHPGLANTREHLPVESKDCVVRVLNSISTLLVQKFQTFLSCPGSWLSIETLD